MILRDYQQKIYDDIKDKHIAILDMPCGSGKTVIEYMSSLNYKTTVIFTRTNHQSDYISDQMKKHYGDTKVNYNFDNKDGLSTKNVFCTQYRKCIKINDIFKSGDDVLLIFDGFKTVEEIDCVIVTDSETEIYYDNTTEIGKLLDKKFKLILATT